MCKTLIEIEKDVRALTLPDKEILLQKLIDEIDPMEKDLEKIWMNKVRHRREEILGGSVKGIPVETAMKELRRSIDERGNSSSGRSV